MTTIHQEDFPFEEIRDDSGDYFPTAEDAMDCTGFNAQHIWSVAEGDDNYSYVYGPSHHVINVLGYIATNEAHDGDTYYEETA